MDLIALRQIDHRRLLSKRLQCDLRLQRRANLPSRSLRHRVPSVATERLELQLVNWSQIWPPLQALRSWATRPRCAMWFSRKGSSAAHQTHAEQYQRQSSSCSCLRITVCRVQRIASQMMPNRNGVAAPATSLTSKGRPVAFRASKIVISSTVK